MPYFLVTSLIDEGMYASSFQVVEADSTVEIAAHMINFPHRWERFLRYAFPRDWRGGGPNYGSLWECVQRSDMTPERLLELIDMTSVDGDSTYQLAIHEANIVPLSEVDMAL